MEWEVGERVKREETDVYYGCFMLCGRNQHNIVKHLSFS